MQSFPDMFLRLQEYRVDILPFELLKLMWYFFPSRNLQKSGAFESEIIEFFTSMLMLCLSRKGLRVTIYAKKMILMEGKYFNLRSPKLQSFSQSGTFFSTGIGILLTLTLSCPFKLEAALWSLGKRVRKYISRKKPTSQRYLSLRISPLFLILYIKPLNNDEVGSS